MRNPHQKRHTKGGYAQIYRPFRAGQPVAPENAPTGKGGEKHRGGYSERFVLFDKEVGVASVLNPSFCEEPAEHRENRTGNPENKTPVGCGLQLIFFGCAARPVEQY